MRAVRVAAWLATTVALAGFLFVYGVSEWRMRRAYEAPLLPLRAGAAPDAAAGEHMARVVGCWAGCHGLRGEGGSEGIEGLFSQAAPTLSQVVPLYSDEELARLVRYGVKRDGTSAIGMVSYSWWPIGDQDLANILAHLRRQPPLPPVPPRLELSLRGRVALATGRWKVSAARVDRSLPRWGELPRTTPYERGRYLASIVCTECHGLDFAGDPLEGGPPLLIVAAYGPEEFRTLLGTGKAKGGRVIRQMGWMPDVGFTSAEIDDLYAFLRAYHGPPAGQR